MVYVDPVTAAVSGGGPERVIFDQIDATMAATWAARPPGIPVPQWTAIIASARQQLANFANSTSVVIWSHDFLADSTFVPIPWAYAAQAAGGTAPVKAGETNHPGIVCLSSTAAANSGYRIRTPNTPILLAGGESTQIVFKPISCVNTIIRMGFGDTSLLVNPTDGAWIHIDGTTLAGKTASNASESTTASSCTITSGIWYRAIVALDPTAASVEFGLYACSAPAVAVWHDVLTTDIPTGSGRQTGHAIAAYNTGIAGPSDLIYLDYIEMIIGRTLVR